MKKKILGISIIMAISLLFVFYGDNLTGCRKKELSQPPQVTQPSEGPQIPQEPIKPKEPQPPQMPKIKEMIIFDVPYGEVKFTHKKHTETFKISCLKCHHTWEEGKVSGDLCKDCHKKQATEVFSSKEAYHKNCKGCHATEKKGPTGCTQCHIRISSRTMQ